MPVEQFEAVQFLGLRLWTDPEFELHRPGCDCERDADGPIEPVVAAPNVVAILETLYERQIDSAFVPDSVTWRDFAGHVAWGDCCDDVEPAWVPWAS